MILCLRRLASGAWKARRSKSTAAPQLLAVVLVVICLIQQTVAASRSDGLTQPRTESSGRSVTGVRKVLKHRVGWVREQVQNASQCTGGSHCHAGQVCEMSKTTSRWMCFDYCSPDRQQAVQCPKNSVCRYHLTRSVATYCQCLETFEQDKTLRDFNCNIKTCVWDNQCADSEVCVSRGSSPGRKCVPTCTGRTCPKNAICSAGYWKHTYKCTCQTGFHLSGTGCYKPVGPNPPVPIITWSTGSVSGGFKACPRNNNSLECEQEFFAVEGVTRELRCEVRDVFPSPTGVKFSFEDLKGEGVDTLTATEVKDSIEEAGHMLRQTDSSTLGHGGDHDPTRTFVYSVRYVKPRLTDANHTFKCVADVYAEDGTSIRVIETRTKPFNVYPCPEMTRDGRCKFSILRLASNPEIFVKNGSELNLECKSSLPLLGDPEFAECSWILRREGREIVKVSFRGSKKVLGSDADRGLRELVQAERMLTKDRRDCNVKISQTERWMEGNWSCSTVPFDSQGARSDYSNNGGVGRLQIRVYVPPASVTVVHLEEPQREINPLPPAQDGKSTKYSFETSQSSKDDERANNSDLSPSRTFACYANSTHPQPYFTFEEVLLLPGLSSSGEKTARVFAENIPGTRISNSQPSTGNARQQVGNLVGPQETFNEVADYRAVVTREIPPTGSKTDDGHSADVSTKLTDPATYKITCRVHFTLAKSTEPSEKTDNGEAGIEETFTGTLEMNIVPTRKSDGTRRPFKGVSGYDKRNSSMDLIDQVAVGLGAAIAVFLLACAISLIRDRIASRSRLYKGTRKKERAPPLPSQDQVGGFSRSPTPRRHQPASVDLSDFRTTPVEEIQFIYSDRLDVPVVQFGINLAQDHIYQEVVSNNEQHRVLGGPEETAGLTNENRDVRSLMESSEDVREPDGLPMSAVASLETTTSAKKSLSTKIISAAADDYAIVL